MVTKSLKYLNNIFSYIMLFDLPIIYIMLLDPLLTNTRHYLYSCILFLIIIILWMSYYYNALFHLTFDMVISYSIIFCVWLVLYTLFMLRHQLVIYFLSCSCYMYSDYDPVLLNFHIFGYFWTHVLLNPESLVLCICDVLLLLMIL